MFGREEKASESTEWSSSEWCVQEVAGEEWLSTSAYLQGVRGHMTTKLL